MTKVGQLRQSFLDLLRKINEDDCRGLASEMAFNLLQSLIPAVFFLIAVFGLVGQVSMFYSLVVDVIQKLAPVHTTDILIGLVDATVRGSSAGLTIIGILITLWSASGSGGVIIKGLQRAYDLHEKKFPVWYTPLISVTLVLSLGMVLILAVYLIMFGDALINWITTRFNLPFNTVALLSVIRWIIVTVSITGMTAFTYALLLYPRSHRLHWHIAFPGAIFFLCAWVSVSWLFSLYVNHIHQFNPVYGALGALIILVSWLYYSSFIFFVGAEIAATRLKHQTP